MMRILAICSIIVSLLPTAAAGAENPSAFPVVRPKVAPDTTAVERILSADDVQLYRDIFALQAGGNMTAADKHITRLSNKILMGHVLHQRFMHPTAYRSRYSELRRWLSRYADHPDARRVYSLALKRRGKAGYPKRPRRVARKGPPDADLPTFKDRRSNSTIRRAIYRDIARDRLTLAGERIAKEFAKGRLSHADVGRLSERLNDAWVRWGTPEKGLAALVFASPIARPIRITTDWETGLAAWRLKDYQTAQTHFQAVLKDRRYDDLAAAGGVWAARAAYRAGAPGDVSKLLRAAYSRSPDSFYGLIAARQLGVSILRDWSPPVLTRAHWQAAANSAGARRAVALSQVGQSERADQELLLAWYRADKSLYKPVLALAYALDLPQAQLRIAGSAPEGQTAPLLNLYPIPSWQPADGFQTEPAMLFALIRQESGFAARARSRSGARGLMQVMPRTAGYIGEDRRLIRDRDNQLYDTGFNMSLGQRYVNYLKSHNATDGDLLLLLAAYNGGPGNVNKWRRNIDESDPLWFIEHIPLRETRGYVERVASNYWIYRMSLGLETRTLDRLAAGLWPGLEPGDGDTDTPTIISELSRHAY